MSMDSIIDNKVLKILFVEDSEYDVELTVSEIKRAGYYVNEHCVETAEAMQEALDTQTWDVIISDYKMPQFSAEKSLETYNQNALDIPFIIISGVVEAESVVSLLKQGAHDFLNKNSLARLIPVIERETRESTVRKAKRQAEQKVSILSLAVEQSPVSVVITDPDGIVEYVNPKFELMSGYKVDEAIGRQFGFTVKEDFIDDEAIDNTAANDGASLSELWQAVRQQGSWNGELCNIHKNGMLYWEYINVSPLEDEDGNIIRFVSIHEDITVRRTYEERLRNQAHYDDLTGLANRVLMMEQLNQAVLSSDQHISTALLCIDLDHFKDINDTLGHAIGDKLLVQAASRLASCIQKNDTLARMGGDEFAIILPRIEEDLSIQITANRIMHEFSRPFIINGQEHFVTASIGIAKYPENSEDPQVLMRNADLAMYQAKGLGRNQCQFFSEEINSTLKKRVAIENALRGVELRNELELLYQPIIDGESNKIILCEGLLRWRMSDGEYVMPDTFIPVAEATGLINQLGEWVIRKACQDLQYIHRHINNELKFAINISPKQLQSSEFSHFVAEQFKVYGIKPSMIELEITENVLIHDRGETNKNLQTLCDLGFSLSIDDFGTGYSSLGYLQKYPFSTLKIDRSFISNIEDSSNNAKLTETMITMSHNLGMQVVAEGVETKGQLSFLQDRNCELMQGYLFSKPMLLSKLIEILKNLDSAVVEFPIEGASNTANN